MGRPQAVTWWAESQRVRHWQLAVWPREEQLHCLSPLGLQWDGRGPAAPGGGGSGVRGGGSSARQRNAQVPQDPGVHLPVWILLPGLLISRRAPHRLFLSYLGALLEAFHGLTPRPGAPSASSLKSSCHHVHICPRLWHLVQCRVTSEL